jgi:hypothetical protein
VPYVPLKLFLCDVWCLFIWNDECILTTVAFVSENLLSWTEKRK